jgi:hypothetical protein
LEHAADQETFLRPVDFRVVIAMPLVFQKADFGLLDPASAVRARGETAIL